MKNVQDPFVLSFSVPNTISDSTLRLFIILSIFSKFEKSVLTWLPKASRLATQPHPKDTGHLKQTADLRNTLAEISDVDT